MYTDLTKVRQSLFNLLSNAAKFTEGGTITLSVHRRLEDGRDWVTFSVIDTGIGIAGDKVALVFDEFAQADASTTRDFGGTGLGLAITKRFCRMMGGDISVESTLGEGTTFTIRLPAEAPSVGPAEGLEGEREAERRQEARPPDEELSEADRRRTVLVIDDDPAACDLLQRALVRDGFDVVVANDGEKGLELARSLTPMAITLDIIMPHVDGWGILKALKADPRTSSIPVVVVSMLDDKSMGFTLGATEFLTKPINRTQLIDILRGYRVENAPFHVLVVEDDEATRRMIRRMLEKENCAVAEAENGRIALERMAEKAPTVIVLDLMMPVMDGFEFVFELRKVEAWRSIPVIVVTVKDVTEEDRRRLNGGIVDILRKGAFGRDELLERLRATVAECAGKPRTSA
ncbi:MAG: response regulator [Planctomycetota bacterium]|jgi:CheY-like chemotaxis protein/anti-sigma regulatory factor (Ser/Thr protein kinase)